MYSKVAIAAGSIVLPNAIEAAARANGDRSLSIYKYASHVNHCWVGNSFLQSEVADLTVDNGMGAYHRFSLIAAVAVPAGVEL